MFDSGIKVLDLIEQVRSEADIAYPISNQSYMQWLNALEQLLYTEIIREQGKIELTNTFDTVVPLDVLTVASNEAPIEFEDIYTVYADETQLIKSTVASGVILPDTYYKIQNNIGLNLKDRPQKLKIIYFVRPVLKTEENIEAEKVMLPIAFIDLAKSKLRGEAYKLANEDEIAAKWINDYNILLETFKEWLSRKQPEFGM